MPILEDGQLFERYRVHRWLGSGIAGESYEAEDRILQRKVTLKLIHPWTTLSDSARRQFFREMQGISLLNHPYLATVLDYGETDGRIYVARRYVSSGSLLGTNGRLWFHPPLPVANAFKYAHQLAQALQYIHQHGYLHGSLTFANVLVLRGPNTDGDGDYAPFLVADVGLANFVRRFGNPRIETLPISAAPEQLGKRVTPASDQFALAVLLYFWLAGRPPYLGTSNEIEHQKLSETITPLSILNPGITLEQESIILRALTVYPEDRHASTLAFADALIASLTSTTRQYAIIPDTLDTLAPQAETPATTDAAAQATPVDQIQSTSAATSAEETPASARPAPFQAEPYLLALEQLLTPPQTPSESIAPAEEQSSLPAGESEEPTEIVHEDFILFPHLPETPRIEEIVFQTEFIQSVPEEASEPQVSKQTDPLILEPSADAQESQASETIGEMPAEPPDSTDFTSQDELPSASQESASIVQPGEPLATSEQAQPVVPLEKLSTARAESERLPGGNESSLSNAKTTPIRPESKTRAVPEENALLLPDEPLPIIEKTITTAPLEELAAITDESVTIFSANGFSPAHAEITSAVLPDEPTPASPETMAIVPPQEFAATTDASETTLSPSEPARPGTEIILQAEISPENVEVTHSQAEISEEQDEVLAIAPTVPLQEQTVHIEESVSPLSSDESASPGTESASIQSEASPAYKEMSIPTELAGTPAADTVPNAPAPAFETEIIREPYLSQPPAQEVHETSSATYPLLDEALITPRLIISSPYTSSSFEFLLIGEETNIGRAGSSDLYLEQDNLTSRHHALLKRLGERVLIFDKRSHNGVFINGQKIEVGRGYELADGDHIGIGNYELIFRSAFAGHVSQLI